MAVTASTMIHLRHNRQFFRGYSPRQVFWHNFVEEANSVFKLFETYPYARALCTQNIAHLCWIGLFHIFFLFACLNCNLYLFVQMQEEAKESSVRSCCPWDVALCVCAPSTVHKYSVQLFCVLCLNALNSFECLNWQGLETRANDKLSWVVTTRSSGPSPSESPPHNPHHLSPL